MLRSAALSSNSCRMPFHLSRASSNDLLLAFSSPKMWDLIRSAVSRSFPRLFMVWKMTVASSSSSTSTNTTVSPSTRSRRSIKRVTLSARAPDATSPRTRMLRNVNACCSVFSSAQAATIASTAPGSDWICPCRNGYEVSASRTKRSWLVRSFRSIRVWTPLAASSSLRARSSLRIAASRIVIVVRRCWPSTRP